MSHILIIYSTIDGQTRRICERIANICREAGSGVDMVELAQLDETRLTEYDKILLGASIRYGRHRPAVQAFVQRHQALLHQKVSGFFSVNAVARKADKNTPQTNPYMQKFFAETDWQPDCLAVFAGRIIYPEYGFFDRNIIRFIMWLTKGPTNVTQRFEFTDWQKVDAFAAQFATMTVNK